MRYLKQLGSQFSISLPRDGKGYLGRECPECHKYFKITPGTGLVGPDLPCRCPYCGHSAAAELFFTKTQREYAKSVVMNQVTGAIIKDLKTLEFNHRARGAFGIGLKMKVTGQPRPVRHYSEMELEEEIVCDSCSLRYTVFGTFAFCPDCGQHNSLQILEKNLAVVHKQIELASEVSNELSSQLVIDAMKNCVSAFDGFGREIYRVHAAKSTKSLDLKQISFQNLVGAQKNAEIHFGIDLSAGLLPSEWASLSRSFQKRHLFTHKMGIVDDDYLRRTNDPHARVGWKITITSDEVLLAIDLTRKLGVYLANCMKALP